MTQPVTIHPQSIEQEIISLYQSGISQKDISNQLGIGVKKIRSVLRTVGFDTSAYLRIPPEFEEVLLILLNAGISYRAVSEVTEISFHVIRDISERHSGRPRSRAYRKPLPYSATAREQGFLSRFLSGESFCAICTQLKLREEEILRCFGLVDLSVFAQHSAALRSLLKGEDISQYHERSLARKYGISTSVVKAYINS